MSVSCTIFEIIYLISENFKTSRDSNHAQYGEVVIPRLLILFSSYSKLFVESHHFNLVCLHLSPQQRVNSLEFRQDLWHQKTRVPGLSCAVLCVILSLAVLTQYKHVADKQIQTRTQQC